MSITDREDKNKIHNLVLKCIMVLVLVVMAAMCVALVDYFVIKRSLWSPVFVCASLLLACLCTIVVAVLEVPCITDTSAIKRKLFKSGGSKTATKVAVSQNENNSSCNSQGRLWGVGMTLAVILLFFSERMDTTFGMGTSPFFLLLVCVTSLMSAGIVFMYKPQLRFTGLRLACSVTCSLFLYLVNFAIFGFCLYTYTSL